MRRVTSLTAARPPITERAEQQPATRLPGIEVLRAIAASGVVVCHLYFFYNNGAPDLVRDGALGTLVLGSGRWGVEIFFLLSSFLLADYFWRDRRDRSLRSFYTRRFFRIAPAYYVMLLIAVVVLGDFSYVLSGRGAVQTLASLTFTHHFFPATSGTFGVNGAVWTLSIEMLLYASLPLLALAFARRPLVVTGSLVLVSFLFGLYLSYTAAPFREWLFGSNPTNSEIDIRFFIYNEFVAFLPLFALGMALKWAVTRGLLRDRWRKPLSRPRGIALALLLSPSLAFLIPSVVRATDYAHRIWFTGFHTAVALLLVPALYYASKPVSGRLTLPLRFGVWLGQRSYGLFLWHFPVILLIFRDGPPLPGPVRVGLAVGFSILLAALSYQLVERPAMNYASRLTRRRYRTNVRGVTAPV